MLSPQNQLWGITMKSLEQTKTVLKALSEKLNLPVHYKDDVLCDLRILQKYGNIKYVWMLRESGSLLFPLEVGANSQYFTYYIQNDSTARYFFLDGFNSAGLTELKKDAVTRLIEKPPFDFSTITEPSVLVDRVMNLLKDTTVTSSIFETPVFNPEPSNWEQWLNWFTGKNKIMENIMQRSIKMLSDFNNGVL